MVIDFEALKKLGAQERVSELRKVVETLRTEIADREKSKTNAEKGNSKEHELDSAIAQLQKEIGARKNELSEAELLLIIAQEESRIEALSKEHSPKAEIIRAAEPQKNYTITQNILTLEPREGQGQKSELENIIAAQRASQEKEKSLSEVAEAYKANPLNKTYQDRQQSYDRTAEDTYARRAYEESKKKEQEDQHHKKPKANQNAGEKIEAMYEGKGYN